MRVPTRPTETYVPAVASSANHHLNGGFRAGTIHGGIDLVVVRGVQEFLTDLVEGFARGVDHVIGAVLPGHGQFRVVSAERHDCGPGRQQLGILDGVRAQAADADDRQHPVRPEGTRVPQFLEASVQREPGVGERCQFFGFQVVFVVDADEVCVRDGEELRIPTVRAKPRPSSMSTNLCVAGLTQAAGAVSPAADNHDLVTLGEPGGCGHETADLFHYPGIFMAWGDGKRQRLIVLKIAIHELHVCATHAGRCHFHQDLISRDVRHGDIFEDERLLVPMHACGAHVSCLLPES
jgi:hypothetical protein